LQGRSYSRGAVAAILFFLFLSWLMPAATAANREAPLIRVLLGQNLEQVDFRVEQGQYRLIDSQTGREISQVTPGVSWTVKKKGNNLKLLREGVPFPGVFGGSLQLNACNVGALNLFSYQGRRYRDNLSIFKETNGILAINTIDLEHYLYSVVAKEMVSTAGLEALKAQAVVSRSFTLAEVKPVQLYDITADTSSQVYEGYESEHVSGAGRVHQAVDATRGQVIYYDGKVIKAFYHANAGGHTEDSENVWSNSLPYLRGVPSPEDIWALEYPRQSPAGWPAYNYSWSVTLTRQQVREKINHWLAGQGQAAGGDITDLVVSRVKQDGQGETVSGRVTRMDIYSDTGRVSVAKNNIRSVFGLKSTLFTIQMDSTINILDGSGQQRQVNSGDGLAALGAAGVTGPPNGTMGEYTVAGRDSSRRVPKSFSQVVFQGRGNGHGLGMSQWGAMGMAEKGYTYQQIIEHYYNQGLFDGRLKIAANY